jgi:DNA-binding NtrC family response regulator
MSTIIVADDDRALRKIIKDRLSASGHAVETAENGREALELIERLDPDLVLLDLQMPGTDGFAVLDELRTQGRSLAVIVITAHGSIEAAVRAMRLGAFDFVQKPFEADHLQHLVAKALEREGLLRSVGVLKDEVDARHRMIVGASEKMRGLFELAKRAAVSDASILLAGESGTGKEVLARAIHGWSKRANGPFIAVNCAALGAELLESELFGHERGAFTGAVRAKPGRIELASGGTLFLDEIGELAPSLQPKLLRALQEREYERVGGARTLRADVRILAATNRVLEDEITAGRFRQDLYYRLKVVTVQLPPLREHLEDVPALASHFLERFAREAGRPPPRLDRAALSVLEKYAWPGNIRELANAMERAVVLSTGRDLGVDDLPEDVLHGSTRANDDRSAAADGYHDAVAAAKRAIIQRALEAEGGHQTRAAKRLGLTQPYLARLLKNLDLR